MTLHVGFGGSPVEHARIDIDEGQILALLFGEAMRAGARIKWMFTTQRARLKLLRAYPDPPKES